MLLSQGINRPTRPAFSLCGLRRVHASHNREMRHGSRVPLGAACGRSRGVLHRPGARRKQGPTACVPQAGLGSSRSPRTQPNIRLGLRCQAIGSGSSISAVHFERTEHPGPLSDVSADQRRCVVRGGVEPPTFRFSGQPRQALCRPAKTDVTDKRTGARRKVQH